VAAGQSNARLKTAFPDLDDDRIALASLYAEANPPRGRPRAHPGAGFDLKLLSERKVARRSRG
jgi:hypothetical protein